jgi:hypothetical protein
MSTYRALTHNILMKRKVVTWYLYKLSSLFDSNCNPCTIYLEVQPGVEIWIVKMYRTDISVEEGQPQTVGVTTIFIPSNKLPSEAGSDAKGLVQ